MNLLNRLKHGATGTFLRVLRHQTGGGYGATGKLLKSAARKFTHQAHDIQAEADGLEAQAITSKDDGQVIENPNPSKASIPLRRPPRGLKRLCFMLRSKYHFSLSVLFPKPTEAQVQAKKDQALIKVICTDAGRAMRIMSNRFKELMFYQRIHEGENKPIKIKKVGFDVIAFDWDDDLHTGGNMIMYHVDTRPGRLPEGVRLTDLLGQESINEIQYSLEHPIKGWANIEGGIIKQMRSMNNGITSFISIQDTWKVMPQNLPMLAFPVGIGESARHYHKDLDDCPHLLVVGATKQGKSNMINGILSTYLHKGLKPSQVQFVLFDCKAGLEFSFFDGIPHLFRDDVITNGIIEDMDKAVGAMHHMVSVMRNRMARIRAAGCKSANDFNMKHRGDKRIPALVICFDDYISLSLMYGKTADEDLTLLSSQGRAAGIYIILGAQYPKSDQFPSIALLNFPVVIAFRLKPGASRSILNNNSAAELECRGRAIFQDFDEDNEVQTPRISDSIIREEVRAAISGQRARQASKVDIEEILDYGLTHLDGRLDVRQLCLAFKGKVGMNKLQSMLVEADEQVYNVSGTLYQVTMRYGRPRRMVLAAENDEKDAAIEQVAEQLFLEPTAAAKKEPARSLTGKQL
jgi:hypothetical protein